jgi:hypothetical protein
LNQAFNWARGLKLVRKRTQQQKRLEISPQGSQWLAGSLEEQYGRVYGVLRPLPSDKGLYSSSSEFLSGIDSLQSYGRGDHRFLGANVIVIRTDRGRETRYWDAKPADHQALRDSIDRSLAALPVGVFHRLDSVFDHLVFEENNPLLLGRGPESVAIFESGRPVPPLVERREEAARVFLMNFVSQRLIPLGCLQAAIDHESCLYIARRPRFDAYFGRKVASTEMAGQAAESRVVVQPDFSIIIVGLNPAPAAELAPFCEREKRGGGHGALMLKLTRASVVKAVAHGLKPAEIVDRLQRLASNEVPSNVLRQVQDWCGWVRRAHASTVTVVRCPDPETADRVLAIMKRQAERVNETTVAIRQLKLTTADRNKLRDQGIVVEGEES